MQKNNILDFFQSQAKISKVLCPACGSEVIKSKLNDHLDSFCTSASTSSNSNLKRCAGTSQVAPAAKRKSTKSSSNRLSLKNQRNKIPRKNNFKLLQKPKETQHSDDDDVVFVEEMHPPTKTTDNGKIDLNSKKIVSKNYSDSAVHKSLTQSGKSVLNSKISKCEVIGPLLFAKSPENTFHSPADMKNNSVIETNCNSLKSVPLKGNSIEIKSESKSDVMVNVEKKNKNAFNISDMDGAKHMLEDDSVFSELSDTNERVEEGNNSNSYTPYYIANFKHILDTVLSEEDNQILFNDEDRNSIVAFKGLSDAAQKLYVRLFQRKYKWLRVSKVNYPEITKSPQQTLEELVKAGLVDSGTSDIKLEIALELLSLPEAKSLAKHFNFSSGKSKSDIKQMLLKHCKEHKSVFFTDGRNGVSSMMLKKVLQLIGSCYRISLLPRRLFTRILMLFSLPTISEDDEDAAGGQQKQLLTLLQVNKGELVFPECKRTRETVIFTDRDELIRYEEARQLENDIINAVESKNFELAKDLYISAKEEYENQCLCSFADRASSLPVFLKRYTSFHVYIRCMTQGVEVLQRLRQYDEAVALLKKLLKQKVFCQDYKGRWYDRLALNLEQHLKKPLQAISAIKNGLKDKNVRVGHQYSLLTRALRITKNEDNDFRKQLLRDATVVEAPKVVIKGRLCPRPILGRRNVFISSSVANDQDDVTVLGVEQLAMEHYRDEGFSEGIHGEGSTFHSLYALLFWDIIYDGNIPDVFISPHQTHPLDLNYESFYESRKDQIQSHLKTLKISTVENMKEIVQTTWESHHGKASLVSWDRFTGAEHVQGLIACLGSDVLCGICERLARDFRFTRSGVPDLVVWNPETLCVKIVEVKGPGDKLSSKQILWLDYLIRLGADAEVCLVEAVASKKLRKETF